MEEGILMKRGTRSRSCVHYTMKYNGVCNHLDGVASTVEAHLFDRFLPLFTFYVNVVCYTLMLVLSVFEAC